MIISENEAVTEAFDPKNDPEDTDDEVDIRVSCRRCRWVGIKQDCDTKQYSGPNGQAPTVHKCPECGSGIRHR